VVDEARFVSADRRVDHDVVVDREEERVVAFSIDVGITGVGFRRREALTRVFDEPRARWDLACGECAEALDR
jgi:hypothetical protein